MTQDRHSPQGIELHPGRVYFVLLYADRDLNVPIVQTLIYVEDRLDSSGSVRHLFNEASSDDNKLFSVTHEDVDHLVIERAELIRRLSAVLDDEK